MRSRKGASQEIVFLLAAFAIALVLLLLYIWLATQTSDRVQGSVEVQAMHLLVDDAVGVWVKENMGRFASDPSGAGEALSDVLSRKGACGYARCVSVDERISCQFVAFKKLCPPIPDLLPPNEYDRQLVVPLELGKVSDLVIAGRFE